MSNNYQVRTRCPFLPSQAVVFLARTTDSEELCIRGCIWRSGRHALVLVGSGPTVVTNATPMLAVRADEIAEKSPRRGREARAPCSRPNGRHEPSRVLSRI